MDGGWGDAAADGRRRGRLRRGAVEWLQGRAAGGCGGRAARRQGGEHPREDPAAAGGRVGGAWRLGAIIAA